MKVLDLLFLYNNLLPPAGRTGKYAGMHMTNPGIRDVGDPRMPAVRDPGGGAVGEWARGSFTTFEVGGVAKAFAFSFAPTNFYQWRTGVWQYLLGLNLPR